MEQDKERGFGPESHNEAASRERVYTPAEHQRHYAPLNRELHPEDAQQFGWRAENRTVQTYQHSSTQHHIHIDGPSGQFFDQEKNPITQEAHRFRPIRRTARALNGCSLERTVRPRSSPAIRSALARTQPR